MNIKDQIINACIPTAEAAKRLGMNTNNLRDLIREGKTPFPAWATSPTGAKLTYIIPREAFENWIAGRTPPSAKEIATELAAQLGPLLPDAFFQCMTVMGYGGGK